MNCNFAHHLSCYRMAERGIFDIFTDIDNLLNKEHEEIERLIFSNSHMTIDFLSPLILVILLSISLLLVAMAFENKSKFVGFTNG